jgi:ATP-dependent Clp protease ATP-binding subunit ClpC
MFERFTDRARKVMALANQEAQRMGHEYIGTEHILLGLMEEGSGVGANVLKNLGVNLRKVRTEVKKLLKSEPEMVTMGKLPQTPRAKRVIEYAMEEARGLGHNYVGTEHLLLGLLREMDGVAAQVLMNLGLKLADVREEVVNLLGMGIEPVQFAHGGEQAPTQGAATPGRADGIPFEEFFKDDAAGKLMLDLMREFERRKDEAVTNGTYEVAAEYRDLMLQVRALLDRLASILSRQKPDVGPHGPTGP